MRNILIPIFPNPDNLWLVMHGTQLAERIGGKVYVLEIKSPRDSGGREISGDMVSEGCGFKHEKKQKEVKSEYYCVRGNFFQECLKIIEEKKIDCVVLTIPRDEENIRQVVKLVRHLKARGICRVELVKKLKKDGGYVSHVLTHSGK